MTEHVKAPWTPEQVKSLNDFQDAGMFHPFTCGNDRCGSILLATPNGWVCRHCDFTQDWVPDYIANGTWRAPAEAWTTLVEEAQEQQEKTPTLRVYSGANSEVVEKCLRKMDLICLQSPDKFMRLGYPEFDYKHLRPLHPDEIVQLLGDLIADFYKQVLSDSSTPPHFYIFTLNEIVLRTVSNFVRNGLLAGLQVEFVWIGKDLAEIRLPLDIRGDTIAPWPDDIFEVGYRLLFHGVPDLPHEVLETFLQGRQKLPETKEQQ